MSYSISFDAILTGNKIRNALSNALNITAKTALEHSNLYCKLDSGELINSSFYTSDLLNASLIWDTPYAKKQYYFGNPNVTFNPNARVLWADFATSVHYDEWLQIFNQQFINELNVST